MSDQYQPEHRADTNPVGDKVQGAVAAQRSEAALSRDARNRAIRTFLQGLAFVVVSAVVTVLLPVFTGADSWDDFDWGRIGFSLFQAVGMAVLAWVWRKYLDRTKVPSAEPPANPGPATSD